MFQLLSFKGMWQYIRAKFRNFTKDRTNGFDQVQESKCVSVLRLFLNLALIYCHINSPLISLDRLQMSAKAKARVSHKPYFAHRPTMIKYRLNNIRELVGHKVDLQMVHDNPLCRLDK